MEYFDNEELYRYFEAEIKSSANKRMLKLKKEIETLKEKAIQSIQEELKESVQQTFQFELKELQTDHSFEINKIMTENGRILMKRRQELLESVFAEVSLKLKNYSKTEAYTLQMKNKINNIKDMFTDFDVIFYVKKGDTPLIDLLKSSYKSPYTLKEVTSIELGGFQVACLQKGIEIDETLDSRLSEKKHWFYVNSHIFIKQ